MEHARAIPRAGIAGMLILGLGLLPLEVYAAPLFSQTARTQFFLGTALRTFGQFQRFEGGGNELKVWTAPAIFSYALITDATLNLVIPYQRRHLETPTGDFDADGIGDITLFGKYRFYRRDVPFGRDQLAFIGGLEFPSGSTTQGPGLNPAKGGIPALQLGSGGVDGLLGLAFAHTRSWYSIEGAVQGKLNSEAEDFRFGNVLLYDLYLAYQTYPEWPTPPAQLNFSVEFNGRTFADNEVEGKTVDSGGTVLFISPGIQYIVTENLLFETGVQVPIVKDFPSGQLEPDFTVLFGLRYIF